MSRYGKLIIISGPSGVGKTAVCNGLAGLPGLRRVVTCTTREPRDGEVDGRHYHFLSRNEFQEGIRKNRFLEHAVVHGQLYGTPREAVEKGVQAGDLVLLNIDVQGASRIREVLKEEDPDFLRGRVSSIFLLPPDLQELKRRLAGRGTDSEDEIRKRLETARHEMLEKDNYDFQVINGHLTEAVREILKRIGYPGEAPLPAQ
jgi:guanylate kinase